MNELTHYIFLIILCGQIFSSCSSSKIIFSDPGSLQEPIEFKEIQGIKCLNIDHRSDYNTNFNPNWISHHKVKRVIGTHYMNNGGHEKSTYFDIYNFNDKGFKINSTGSRINPTHHFINEKNLAVIHENRYEDRDSFLIRHYRQIRFKDRNGRLSSPDTLDVGLKSTINIKAGRQFIDENGEIVEEYIYDEQNRLTEIYNRKGKLSYKYTYLPDNEIGLIKYYNLKPSHSVISLNNRGQIIGSLHKENGFLYKYEYDEKGVLLRRNSFSNGKMRHYIKYSYY